MPRIRPLNKNKYGISKHRFYELYHYCLQYWEWQDELLYCVDCLSAAKTDGQPHGSNISDSTSQIATKRAMLSDKCKVIEDTILEVAEDIYPYLLKAVTHDNITFNYLSTVMNIPCGQKYYYQRRRKFYWLLSKKL